jgi:hypothetical protein
MYYGGDVVRKRKFVESLTIKISSIQRAKIEALANSKETTIGEATRELIDAGLQLRGIE